MNGRQTGREPAVEAADAIAPEGGVLGRLDPAAFGASVLSVLARAAERPAEVAAAWLRFGSALVQVWPAAIAGWLGGDVPPPVVPDAGDRRFADRAWEDNPGYVTLRQVYLAARRLSEDLLAAGRGDPLAEQKAQLAVGFLFDALAPTNFLPTNPAAVKMAFDTGGASLIAGARNFLDDLAHNGGRPRQVDTSSFELGRNLAATPGRVVFRNDLMEVIQYTPQTTEVRAVPLLASPPWINKYYVMDLAPGRSFIEWAVRQRRTVFAISYRNPGPSMSGVTLDDYLIGGPKTALDVISDITGSAVIDIVGLCLGGALTAMLAAHLAGTGDDRLGSITLLNTMLDYSEPGALGAFADERTVARLEAQMARTGGMEGSTMAGTFDVLRADDLIFNYVVSGWLMGQPPPAFDILAWNADSTRLPAAMHSFYLRSLYVRNELANGEMELAGRLLSLAGIKSDAYVVGAVNDHIVPWQSSYRATGLLGGNVRYVLSSGGHIAGIVNPPSPKAWYLASEDHTGSAARWREAATKHDGSWWEDWTSWADARAGQLVPPPPMGSTRHPAVGDAPGDYVRG
ncbi:MAG TPA: alpha/beta fold hydrolase [Streptosporangiaceae bacterium]|nr:alpha/beta fold hydrolase [Streptosporangiaceae bacterium]